ncbi:unnamed protein product [Phytophthora lilii]|uniref:Unnamed protein product n=1 Tax=Phytophthora lilii TaxID=2077276 RepID=A0A9W6U2R9_9STRA|nr:unnamed protein product [Phytophthora lilii]
MAKELASRLARLQEENELKKQRCDTNLARALALVQRDHLRRSKEDQTNLVAAVSNQAAYLSILRGLFPASDSITMKHETSFSIASSLQVNMKANRVLFGEHLRQVIAAHDQVDDVFREYDVLAMPDGMACSMRTPYTTGGTEYFQHFNKFSQPFSVKQTQQAWWRLASLSGVIENRENYDDIADPNDTVILRVRLVRKLVTGAEISIIQRYICRRVVEENRALLTWKTFSEGEGIFAGMQLEETGWACLQPSMDGDSTVIGVCVRQSPMRFGNLRVQQTENQEFCDFMHNLVKENAQLMTNLISKTLMDDTLADIDI